MPPGETLIGSVLRCFLSLIFHVVYRAKQFTIGSEEVVLDLSEYLGKMEYGGSYINSSLGGMADKKFVITEQFRSLLKKLNSGEKLIPIRGPKGVGKSLALSAIAALCHGKSPCLFVTPSSLIHSAFFDRYLMETYALHEKSKF
jgi:hypothetical protein